MSDCLDQNFLTFILTAVCTPAHFRNPYLVSKLVEILFVINPAVQERTQELFLRMMSHPISEEHLPPALMKFYTGNISEILIRLLEGCYQPYFVLATSKRNLFTETRATFLIFHHATWHWHFTKPLKMGGSCHTLDVKYSVW